MEPIYRLTVFEDDGTTPLTPRGGAPHSDEFQVATATGVSGFQPYMLPPEGRRGKIDPLNMKTDTGWLAVGLLDPAVATTQDERWVTAFLGDGFGENQLIGKPCLVEESTDAGGAWADFFRGRIQKPGAPNRTLFTLVVQDTAEDQQTTIFVGDPSVSYAAMASLAPLGLVSPFGAFSTVPMLPGIVKDWSHTGFGSGKKIIIDAARIAGRDVEGVSRIITEAFRSTLRTADAGEDGKVTKGRIHIEWPGNSGEVWPALFAGPADGLGGQVTVTPALWYPDTIYEPNYHWILAEIGVQALDGSDPEHVTLPTDGTEVDFYIKSNTRPTKTAPLLIDWTHPVQLWKDILDGKFGPHSTAGVPLITVGYDSSAFSTLLADDTIPEGRFSVEKSWNMAEFIEKNICQPYGLSYRINASGEVVPLDMRMPASLPGTTIDEDDLAEEPPGWEQDRGSAIAYAEGDYYTDRVIAGRDILENPSQFPDVPSTRIDEVDHTLRVLVGDLSITDRTFRIDAAGWRASEGLARKLGSVEGVWIPQHLLKRLNELRSPFGHGQATIRVATLRAASTNGCWPGDTRILDVSIPNAADVKRSGQRVVRCVGRQEDGPRIILTFLDLGAGLVAVAPSLGTLRLVSGEGKHRVEVDVTRNASDEDVLLEYAVTTTAVGTQPAAGSDLWTFGGIASADGYFQIANLPSGQRIWVRGRTEPATLQQAKIPSSWVSPTPQSIDTTAMSAPTGFVVTPSGCFANAAWTNTEDEPVELFLDGALYDLLIPSASTWTYEGLVTSTAYTGAARYADGFGGFSPSDSDGFSTSGTPDTAPDILGIGILVGVPQ